jgi:hypothetical protein
VAFRITAVSSTWHEFADKAGYVAPDLVIGFHPGINDLTYPWRDTLHALGRTDIPLVFTSFLESDHEKDLELVSMLGFGVRFKEPAPFLSPVLGMGFTDNEMSKRCVIQKNAFWFGGVGPVNKQAAMELLLGKLDSYQVSK